MSTLKVNKLRDTAGSADAIVLDPNGGAVLAGVTTVTSVKVGAAVTISESGIEATGVGITVANINGTQIGGRRNIIINGAMQVAQRGTSSATSDTFAVDRFKVQSGGFNEVVTASQISLSTSTSPTGDLFRNAARITNGDQTSGAQVTSYVQMMYNVEAQDMANSGWQYASSSSFITLSFYVRSSVAQTFYGWVNTVDGTGQRYTFDIPVTQADTWTRIIKKIPGNSNLTFDNDTGPGLQLLFVPFYGTNYTNDKALNSWAANDGTNYCPDMTTTWFTTNDSTFDITGVQIEVGPQATPFEHRSFGEELRLCQRYFQSYPHNDTSTAEGLRLNGDFSSVYQTPMRAVPVGAVYGVGGTAGGNSGKYDQDAVGNQTAAIETKHSGFEIDTNGGVGLAAVTLDAEI